MIFSDTTNKDGILQECEFWVFGSNYGSITSNATRLAEFTRLSNRALDRITTAILDSDTRWQWDDTNYTDFPIGMTNLADGQRDYTLEVSHLKILGVEAKDSSGNYYPLKPIDTRDMTDSGISPTEFMSTKGLPQYYDLIANSVMIYPQPDVDVVTATNGLKVRFQRGPSYYETTDTTKEAGFASIFHRLIPLYASFDYATANDMVNKATVINNEITKEEGKLKKFMTKRDKAERSRITTRIKRAK